MHVPVQQPIHHSFEHEAASNSFLEDDPQELMDGVDLPEAAALGEDWRGVDDSMLESRSKSSICEHGRVTSLCQDCGGSGICQHERVRNRYKDCGGSCILAFDM